MTHYRWHRGRRCQWRGIEGGGVSDNDGGRGQRQGSGMMMGSLPVASRPKAGTTRCRGRRQRHRGRRRRWRSIEGGSGAEGGKLGQPDGANQNFTVIRFCVGGVTPLIPDTLLVSADIVQPIPIIFCIGWLTSADTDMLSLYITPTHHCSDRAPQWWRLLFRLRLTF
jgi:hypothetical protein